MQAFNQTRGAILCARLEDAGGLGGKSRGLLGRDGLDPDMGMLFKAGRLEPFMWMHMFFMRFPIDILFLDRHRHVLRICHSLKPWRLSPPVWGAGYALELASGAASRIGTENGDLIEIVPS
ncbi:MAG: DUF192 domain-containing protein [Candidatus Binataceae bacterium]|nr:DUF192 domain-containing protein [Candidatus Binataceae bacterium]